MDQANLGEGLAADGPTWAVGKIRWGQSHPSGSTNVQAGVDGGSREQPDALRIAFLESGLRSAQSHNVNLQHHVAFLQAQMIGHLSRITKLQTRVRALESELTSLKANVSLGNPVPTGTQDVNSVAVDSAAAHPVAAGATPPLSPAAPPAQGRHLTLPAQQREPTPPTPAAPGVTGNDALWNLRPKGADMSWGPGTVLTTYGTSESGAMQSDTTEQAARPPSPIQPAEPAADSFSGAPADVPADSSADPSSPRAAVAETISTVIADQAENSSSCSTIPTAVKRAATSRHPLHDFWVDNISRDNVPPASIPRKCGLRVTEGADDPARKRNPSDGANAGEDEGLEPVHDSVGHMTHGAEEREAVSAANTTTKTELVAPSERTCRTARTPVLRCATEGREGAEDRSSHLMYCALCQDPFPEDESIGRCEACPRSFCAQCLGHGLHEEGVDVEGLAQDARTMLDGGKGDFFVEQCPHCIRGADDNFSAPSPGAAPMAHLLDELMRHDLSICFREPVDTNKHPDYVEAIGRDAMMDLGTMLDKLKRKRYPRRRGPGQFLEDLNRIWRNCRRYAGCDELGQPRYGTTVPGIVRCALILEAMAMRFCAAYMSDNNATEAWQESTWDFYRERQERMNAQARLEQLKNQGRKSESKVEPLGASGIGGTNVNVDAKQEYRERSSNNGGAAGKSPGEENGKPGFDRDALRSGTFWSSP
eukprot:g15893.t1